MDATKCRAYNKTRQSLLCADATVVDSALDPLRVLKVLVEGLDPATETGIYLKNFSGVPVAGALSPFDLMYLNQENRVIQVVALSPDFEVMPFTGRAAAALVLPSGCLASSRTCSGDELVITAADVEVSEPESIPISTAPERAAESPEPLLWASTADELTRLVADEVVSQPEAIPISATPEQAVESPEPLLWASSADELTLVIADEMVSQPEAIPISAAPEQAVESTELLSQTSSDNELVLVFADEMVSQVEPIPISSVPEQAAEGTEPGAEQFLEHDRFDPSLSGDGSGEQEAALQQLDEGQETEPQEQDSLEAQLRHLVAQKPDGQVKVDSSDQWASLEREVRRSINEKGNRVKRVRFWASSTPATQRVPPARKDLLKAHFPGSVDLTEDEPGQASAAAASAPVKQKPISAARKESMKIRFLRRIDYFLRWLSYREDEPEEVEEEDSDQRRGKRTAFPDMIAFYWTGGLPKPSKVGDISVSGFYLITDDRWSPGTILQMTLQRANAKGNNPKDAITVQARVVRWGPDGEGFEFVLTKLLE